MFNLRTAIIALVAMVLIGCAVYKTRIDVPEAKVLTNSLSRIVHKAEVSADGETWKEASQKGTSFPIGDGFQVALSHCDVKDYVTTPTPFGLLKQDVQVRNRSYWIGDVEIELVARLGDISIYQKPYEVDNPFTMGTDPDIGTELLVLGDSFVGGTNWKTGIVSMLDAHSKAVKKDEEFGRCFTHTIPLNPGDSGSPVLAMNQEGNYEVVGIVNAANFRAQLYNLAFPVSYIQEAINLIGE